VRLGTIAWFQAFREASVTPLPSSLAGLLIFCASFFYLHSCNGGAIPDDSAIALVLSVEYPVLEDLFWCGKAEGDTYDMKNIGNHSV
jgi:hypothetical protein